MDSRIDTYKHIQTVQTFLTQVGKNLLDRSLAHDQSKLVSPEVEGFDEYTPKLAGSTYGSDEYKSFLAGLKPALDHHYAHNSHHPEFYPDGIRGMDLLDLIEMVCDWLSAVQRHQTGCILCSIEINQSRFGYGDELKAILVNTVERMPRDRQQRCARCDKRSVAV
jgi:hypothetical protein